MTTLDLRLEDPTPVAMFACLVVAVILTVVHLGLVPRLTEPEPEPDDPFTKPPYATLLRPWVVFATVALAAATSQLAAAAGSLAPAFVVWAGLATLAMVDALTTYLPSMLHWLGAAQMLVALAVVAWLRHDIVGVAWRAALGAALMGGLFWILWRLGPMHYGDVRLVALLGSMAGVAGLQFAYLSLLFGTMAGAVHGIAVRLWRRRHPSPLGAFFAYGPALWSGPWWTLLAMKVWL